MTTNDSRWVLGLSLVCAVTLAGALVSVSHDAREQTVRLERIAAKLDRVSSIPPETQRAMRELLKSVRANGSGVDEHLASRRARALDRIETALSAVPTVASLQPGAKP